jgi:2-amino-4-ketopentanoate thiolase beta subunit
MPADRCRTDGQWVEVERVLLEPADRAANLPEETASKPLLVWVKGFALGEAAPGEECEVETMTGRVVRGRLSALDPAYTHTFGSQPSEIAGSGATCARALAHTVRRRVSDVAGRTEAIMARKGEIMRRALGMDYAEFERPIAFDYEAMMAAHGYSLADIVAIQARPAWAPRPCSSCATSPTSCARTPSRPRRAHLREGRGRQHGGLVQGPACVHEHPRGPGEKGYAGVIAATSGNYGAAVASQAARASLKCIICQEAFDSTHLGQPEIIEKARLCEAFGAEVVQMTVGPELFAHMLELLDETGYFAASLYSSFGVSGIETLGFEIAEEMRGAYRRAADARGHHARGRRQHHRHRAGLKRAGATETEIVSASVDLSGLHMASDTDFNRKSFTTGHTGFGVPFATWPDRADVPRNAARSLRYMDRYLTVSQGEVFYVTEALAKLEGLERGPAGNTAMAAAMSLARDLPRDATVVVQETEYTGAGKHHWAQLNFARERGVEVRAATRARTCPGSRSSSRRRPSRSARPRWTSAGCAAATCATRSRTRPRATSPPRRTSRSSPRTRTPPRRRSRRSSPALKEA